MIYERRAQARAKWEQIKKEQQEQIKITEAPLNVMKEDFAFRKNKPDQLIYRPEYKPAEEIKLESKVTGLDGVTDFDAFTAIIKKKKQRKAEQSRTMMMEKSMNQSSMNIPPEAVDPSNVTGMQQIPEDDTEANRVTDASGVYETIAPSVGVAQKQALEQQKQEEAEKIREEQLAKMREEEE